MADNKRGRGDRDENQENRNECKSAKAIKLLREVTSLLSEGDSEPYQPAAEQISQVHGQVGASGIVQNFRDKSLKGQSIATKNEKLFSGNLL